MSEARSLFEDQLNEERFGPLDERERMIWGVLQGHLGAGMGIKCPDLAHLARMDIRSTRAIIHELRARHHCRICSDHRGYYLPRDRDEWDRFFNANRKKACSIFEAIYPGQKITVENLTEWLR